MDPRIQKAIAFLISRNKALESRLAALEHTVNDVVVKSLVEANAQYEYDTGLEAFRGAHPELADLDPKLKALYGDEYDTAKAFYDNRPESYEEGMDENGWVASMLEEINGKLSALMGLQTPVEEAPAEEAPVAEGSPAEGETVVEEEIAVPDEEQLKAELKAARGE